MNEKYSIIWRACSVVSVEFPQSQARTSEVIPNSGFTGTKTDEIRFSHNGIVSGNNRSHVSSSYSVD